LPALIRVRYFAALREAVGTEGEEVSAEGIATVADLLAHLRSVDEARAGALAPERRVLVAVNQEHASAERGIADGDEVAFFPPVTGGDR